MIKVTFESADGEKRATYEALSGVTLLEVGQDNGQPLEGTCEGQMACSTCHVIVASEHFARLPKASEDEEDMLDFAAATTRTSRLSCQITLDASLDGISVRIPPQSRNMQGR